MIPQYPPIYFHLHVAVQADSLSRKLPFSSFKYFLPIPEGSVGSFPPDFST